MLPLELQTPPEIVGGLAARARALRIARGFTQHELAERAGVALPTLRRFERTGKVALDRLLMIAVALDAARPFDELFAPPSVRSLADLEAGETPRRRPYRPRRGRKRA